MPSELPASALELRSTLTDDGLATLAIRDTAVVEPGDDQVVVRVEAAPDQSFRPRHDVRRR